MKPTAGMKYTLEKAYKEIIEECLEGLVAIYEDPAGWEYDWPTASADLIENRTAKLREVWDFGRKDE